MSRVLDGTRARRRFAAVVPAGPGPIGLWRAVELIKSLARWEPELAACAVLDDAPVPRGMADLKILPPRCRVITITNLRQGGCWHWTAGLSASILSALRWILTETDVDFVLRIDADALVIDRFVDRVAAFLEHRPDIGVIGTLGLSCNPSVRARQNLQAESKFVTAYRLWPRVLDPPGTSDSESLFISGFRTPVTIDARRSFDSIRAHVEEAIRNGFATSEYCQGGALIITRAMIERMARAGYLSNPEVWLPLAVTDDIMIAMYARAVGLSLCDCSAPGQPFGVQHRGLPYPPRELVRRRHAIIHSVKNDSRYAEHDIRKYFSDRTTKVKTSSS